MSLSISPEHFCRFTFNSDKSQSGDGISDCFGGGNSDDFHSNHENKLRQTSQLAQDDHLKLPCDSGNTDTLKQADTQQSTRFHLFACTSQEMASNRLSTSH